MKREGRTAFRWLEIGVARIEDDGRGHHQIYLDRLPVGGFNGRVYLSPTGSTPPDLKSEPQRPAQIPEALDAEDDI